MAAATKKAYAERTEPAKCQCWYTRSVAASCGAGRARGRAAERRVEVKRAQSTRGVATSINHAALAPAHPAAHLEAREQDAGSISGGQQGRIVRHDARDAALLVNAGGVGSGGCLRSARRARVHAGQAPRATVRAALRRAECIHAASARHVRGGALHERQPRSEVNTCACRFSARTRARAARASRRSARAGQADG